MTLLSGVAQTIAAANCDQWGRCELKLTGPATGNPFVDVKLTAEFTQADQRITAAGFYDGDGVYRVRFSPPTVGEWSYVTSSNAKQLDGQRGSITAAPPTGDNHGPVRVARQFHFAYADGTPFKPLGTTCYAWTSQPDELQERTLETLAAAPFNKVRMCVFPKRYTWNENEPPSYALEGTPPDQWEFDRFNPEFFRQLERRIDQLAGLGIQADLILLHPYDKGHWGFDRMPAEADDRYLRYVVSRLAAFRNVWWSLANEYDFMKEKEESDWDRMIRVVTDADPYGRLTSIHNGFQIYNHTNPRLTHASIQNGSAAEDPGRAVLYRDAYRKPILLDEIKYEGDIPKRWGNLSAEEMTHRCWNTIIAGCYPTHGECYLADDDILWWAKGGVLKGQSPARLAFLKQVLDNAPAAGIDPIDKWQHPRIAGQPGAYYLVYLGKQSPEEWYFVLPKHGLEDGMRFRVDVLDAWNMTVTPIDGEFVVKQQTPYLFADENERTVPLPSRPYQCVRIERVEKSE
ncbi:DUF5060 domain-containing protein [Posidoniimonas polymericola]|uniref:DUF5060 domain-containing protein n=1 Tax=Posidoniimonas polymericola TaxID=2528002 RepID=UPI0018D43D5C|nr:DUF5060 domain-containing protein [Posidoniimonas polymericola]